MTPKINSFADYYNQVLFLSESKQIDNILQHDDRVINLKEMLELQCIEIFNIKFRISRIDLSFESTNGIDFIGLSEYFAIFGSSLLSDINIIYSDCEIEIKYKEKKYNISYNYIPIQNANEKKHVTSLHMFNPDRNLIDLIVEDFDGKFNISKIHYNIDFHFEEIDKLFLFFVCIIHQKNALVITPDGNDNELYLGDSNNKTRSAKIYKVPDSHISLQQSCKYQYFYNKRIYSLLDAAWLPADEIFNNI